MFYKVLKDDKVVDVLDRLVYLKYQEKYDRMIFCGEEEAQAIYSSDGKHIWHEESLYLIPVDGYDTVRLEEIDEYEYEQLKVLNMKTPEEIIDAYTAMLLSDGVIQMNQFVESLKRLYDNHTIKETKVVSLYNNNKITKDEMAYILGKQICAAIPFEKQSIWLF